MRLARQDAPRGDMKIINTAIKELRHALGVFGRYRGVRKVTIFGSARLAPDSPECVAAREFAAQIADRGFMVITGGAGGIMQAGNEGAGRARTFGVNIRLPFEQGANPILVGDEKLVWFKYFFTRKLIFVKESDAIVLFPGGFGTHDEGFETLTLAQTGKNRPIPIVLVDPPGGTYWAAWRRFVEEEIVGRGLASRDDVGLFETFDDAGLAADAIARFYTNYHSSRFVGDRFVIRLARPIPHAALATLNAEFGDLLVSGAIETTAALEGEENEPEIAALPRLALNINRHRFARLKKLIDRLNSLY